MGLFGIRKVGTVSQQVFGASKQVVGDFFNGLADGFVSEFIEVIIEDPPPTVNTPSAPASHGGPDDIKRFCHDKPFREESEIIEGLKNSCTPMSEAVSERYVDLARDNLPPLGHEEC